jgi:hypothetical protein
MIDYLTDANFLIFCAKAYDNPTMHSTDEFMEDLDRIKYIKKLFTRYIEVGELKERLILNHLITLHNCFGTNLARILYLKFPNQFQFVKPFLVLLNALPKTIHRVNNTETIYTDDIPMDQGIVRALRVINNG